MENPYYGEAENSTTKDKITVTDNSYYGGVESNTTNYNIIVVDNPYYEGIRNENDQLSDFFYLFETFYKVEFGFFIILRD